MSGLVIRTKLDEPGRRENTGFPVPGRLSARKTGKNSERGEAAIPLPPGYPWGRGSPLAAFLWSGRRESNPQPTAWKAVTLPLSYSRGIATKLLYSKQMDGIGSIGGKILLYNAPANRDFVVLGMAF
jgi:hypothetical protein